MAKQFALNNVITSIFLIPEIPKNAAKIRNIPHIRNNYSEKSTRFNAPPPFPSETTTRITESLVHLYLYSLRGHSPLIEVSRREAYLVVPVDGEWVEAERLEVVEVLELAADALLHQRQDHRAFHHSWRQSLLQDCPDCP